MGGGAVDICETDLERAAGSFIGRREPRMRLIVAFAFVISVITLNNPWLLASALLASLSLLWLARLPFHDLRHRLLHVEGFMLLLFALLPFSTPGKPLFTLGPFIASSEGVQLTLSIILTVNASVLAIFALLSSLETVRLGHAMARLGTPLKLVHLFLFTVRYIAVFRSETGRLREAMRARAFVAGSNRHTWRTLGNLSGMMLIRSLERAERVDEAMRCRGFTGRFPMLTTESLNGMDYTFGITSGCILLCMLLANWYI